MAKLLQNRIAESTFTLPVMAAVTLVVWLLCGLVPNRWWAQLVCFGATTYLMVELSNSNALLRVRSRMVSCTFLTLSCASCFLFGSLSGGIVQLCMAAATIILFHTYQDSRSPGLTFYSFLCIGLGSLVFVQMLFLVPFIWLLMLTQLQSLNWRSWLASIIGLVTPYWLSLAYFVYQKDTVTLWQHFAQLGQLSFTYDHIDLTVGRVATLAFVVVLTLMGVAHCWLRSFEDKIRIRQLYGYFIIMSLVLFLFLVLQPQWYDMVMPLLLIHVSPVTAHYLTLTHSRATNIIFIVAVLVALLLTVFHLLSPYLSAWMPS